MANLIQDDLDFLLRCQYGSIEDHRNHAPDFTRLRDKAAWNEIGELLCQSNIEQPLRSGASQVMVALIPDSFDVIEELFSKHGPRGMHETHFIMLSAMDERGPFIEDEQVRIQEIVVRYLETVTSNASFSAYKAGWLLAGSWIDTPLAGCWHSTENTRRLQSLMFEARYAAGREAGVEGYAMALKKHAKLTDDELLPLHTVARIDRSKSVREHAQFHLKNTLEGKGASSSSREQSRSPGIDLA